MESSFKATYEKQDASMSDPATRVKLAKQSFCPDHPDIMLRQKKLSGGWTILHERCPACAEERHMNHSSSSSPPPPAPAPTTAHSVFESHVPTHTPPATAAEQEVIIAPPQATLSVLTTVSTPAFSSRPPSTPSQSKDPVIRAVHRLRTAQNATDTAKYLMNLRDLAYEPGDQVKIADAGGIQSIVNAMRQHSNHVGVQALGCWALANLAVRNNGNKVKIADAGGIQSIVDAMRQQHSNHAGVQKNGCWALVSLAANNNGNRIKIAAAGGIQSIVNAMRQHSNDAAVQEYGCWAFRNLAANNNNNRIKIAAAGGIQSIVEAMRQHSNHAKVQEYGCLALAYLAVNDANQVKIANAGGIQSIVDAMRQHSNHGCIQLYGCGALYNFSFSTNKWPILKSCGVEKVLHEAKCNFPQYLTLQEWSSVVLDRIS